MQSLYEYVQVGRGHLNNLQTLMIMLADLWLTSRRTKDPTAWRSLRTLLMYLAASQVYSCYVMLLINSIMNGLSRQNIYIIYLILQINFKIVLSIY